MEVWAQIWPIVQEELNPQKQKRSTYSSFQKPTHLEECADETDLF